MIFLYLLTFGVCCLFLSLLLSAHLLLDPVLTPCMAAQRVILLQLSSEPTEATVQQNDSFLLFLDGDIDYMITFAQHDHLQDYVHTVQ